MTLKVDGTNGVLQAYDYQVLTTGFSYTFAAGTQTLVINPAGTLATGTITMPASPVDGMVITVTSTQPIVALTVNANTGQSINNGGTLGLQAGGSLSYVYRLSNTTWQPFNASLSVGVGQTWQNFTVGTQRIAGTTYTNSTGRTISAIVNGASSAAFTAVVGGISLPAFSGSVSSPNVPITFMVPPGSTYQVNSGGGSIVAWSELR